MADETPISAWHPPSAAEMVAPFLKMQPISAAVSRKLWQASSSAPQKQPKYSMTAGMTPADPFVGAVTTRPNAAFSSLTASAKQLTQSSTRWKFRSGWWMAASHWLWSDGQSWPSSFVVVRAALRRTFSPPGRMPVVWHPRCTLAIMACLISARSMRISSADLHASSFCLTTSQIRSPCCSQ